MSPRFPARSAPVPAVAVAPPRDDTALLRRRLLLAEAERADAASAAAAHADLADELGGRVAALRAERRLRDHRHQARHAALQTLRDELAASLERARAEHLATTARLRAVAAERDELRAGHAEAVRTAERSRARAVELTDALSRARAEADHARHEAARVNAAHEEWTASLEARIASLRTERRARDRRSRAEIAALRAKSTDLGARLAAAQTEAAAVRAAAGRAAAAHDEQTAELRRRLETIIADVAERDTLSTALVASALAEAEEQRAAALRAAGEADALRHRVSTLAGQIGAAHKSASRARRAGERDREQLAAEAERAGALAAELETLRAELARLRRSTRAPRRRGVLRHTWMLGAGAGVLMVADGVTTIAWQEPISALYAQQQQDRLRDELPAVVRRFAPLARGRVRLPSLAAEAVELARTTPTRGPLGRIAIPSLGVRFVMVQGADKTSLELGPGHYTGTVLPGRPGTVGIAGHRTTYLAPFRHIDRLGRGARVVLHMPYGTFTYRVSGRRYVSPTDTSVLRARGGAQRLVLTTCDPLFSDAQRLVVFAKLRSVRRA